MMYMAIGVGGIIGALLRFYLGIYIHSWWTDPFPLGTLAANYLGCIALGAFSAWVSAVKSVPVWLQAGISTGVIGSFTTFSTFSIETMELFQNGLNALGCIYILSSLFGGLALAWLGRAIVASRSGIRH